MPPKEWSVKAPRLATIAKWINENTTLAAEVCEGYCNTDRKIGRLRIPGKGIKGKELRVAKDDRTLRDAVLTGRNLLFQHNSAETYRSNHEVVCWLTGYLSQIEGSS